MAGGDGIDHIVEVGGAKTLPQSLRAIHPGGTMSMIGVLSGAIMEASLGLIVTRKVRMQGITVGSRIGFEAMAKVFSQHRIKPVIDRVFTLKTCVLHWIIWPAGPFGKVCIRHDGQEE